jgi:hypothetical protein
MMIYLAYHKKYRYIIRLLLCLFIFTVYRDNTDEYEASWDWGDPIHKGFMRGHFQIVAEGGRSADFRGFKFRNVSGVAYIAADVYAYIDTSYKIYIYGREEYVCVEKASGKITKYIHGIKINENAVGSKSSSTYLKELYRQDYIELDSFEQFDEFDREIFRLITKRPNFKKPYKENLGGFFQLEQLSSETSFRLLDIKRRMVLSARVYGYLLDGEKWAFIIGYGGYIKLDLAAGTVCQFTAGKNSLYDMDKERIDRLYGDKYVYLDRYEDFSEEDRKKFAYLVENPNIDKSAQKYLDLFFATKKR